MYNSDKKNGIGDEPITIRLEGEPKTDLIEISKKEERTPTGEIRHLINEQKLRLQHKEDAKS